MSDPFLGQITMFGGNFAPRGWALCNGQLLDISSNTALFSILGTTFGGDGRTTFGLPDLRGRTPLHSGGSTGPGLSSRPLGSKGGTETVTLTTAQMPSHQHLVTCSEQPGTTKDPENNLPAEAALPGDNQVKIYATGGRSATMAQNMITKTGDGQSHDNMQPYQAINYIIALVGWYPSRS